MEREAEHEGRDLPLLSRHPSTKTVLDLGIITHTDDAKKAHVLSSDREVEHRTREESDILDKELAVKGFVHKIKEARADSALCGCRGLEELA